MSPQPHHPDTSVRTDHLFRFWGRDRAAVIEMLPPGTHLEQEPGEHGAHAAWFPSAEAREEFRRRIPRDVIVVHDPVDGPQARTRTVADVTLRHEGKDYAFSMCFGFGYPEHSAVFMFEDGNYSCDDNRSSFIQRYCDPDFAEIEECGDTIELVSIATRQEP